VAGVGVEVEVGVAGVSRRCRRPRHRRHMPPASVRSAPARRLSKQAGSTSCSSFR